MREISVKIAVKVATEAYRSSFVSWEFVLPFNASFREGLASTYPEPENIEDFIRAQLYDYNYNTALPSRYTWPQVGHWRNRCKLQSSITSLLQEAFTKLSLWEKRHPLLEEQKESEMEFHSSLCSITRHYCSKPVFLYWETWPVTRPYGRWWAALMCQKIFVYVEYHCGIEIVNWKLIKCLLYNQFKDLDRYLYKKYMCLWSGECNIARCAFIED